MLSFVQQFSLCKKKEESKMRFVKRAACAVAFAACVAAVGDDAMSQAPSAVNLQPWRLSYAGRTLLLMKGGLGGSELDLGIALLHMSLGVGEKEHEIQWGEGKEIAALLAEDRG